MVQPRRRLATRLSVGPEGRFVAMVYGAEVLVWDGQAGLPLWRHLGEHGVYTDVAVSGQAVWVVDDTGHLEHRRATDGALLWRRPAVQGRARHVVARGEVVAVASSDAVVWLREGRAVGRVDAPGVTALAVDGAVQRLGVAQAEGTVAVVPLWPPDPPAEAAPETPQDLPAGGRVEVGGPPEDLAWCRDGYWLAVVSGRCRPVQANAAAVAAPKVLRAAARQRLALAVDDAALVAQVGPREVRLAGLEDAYDYGRVQVGRDVVGVAASGEGTLWLGLEHGDVQRIDLLTGQATALDPQPGRARVPWALDMAADVAGLRGLRARRQAGHAPLAVAGKPLEEQPRSAPWGLVWKIAGGLLVATILGVILYVVLVWLDVV